MGKIHRSLFHKEAAAETLFADTMSRYQELAAQAATVTSKPTLFTDSDYQGTWYVAGGESFAAKMFADAGA